MLGLLLTAAAIALSATPASAGTYNIYSCTASTTHSAEGWVGYEVTAGESGGLPYFYNKTDCTSGFYRRFEINTVPGGATSALPFVEPADTYLASAPLYQNVLPRSAGA